MKKILLSLVAVLLSITAFAQQEVTVTIKGTNGWGTTTVSGFDDTAISVADGLFTFTTTAGTNTKSAYNKAGDLRLYAGATFTLANVNASTTITKVVFNVSSNGLKRLAAISADKGSIALQASGDSKVTWTGETNNSVTFTVGNNADYGTESTKAGQLCIDSFTVTYVQSGTSKENANISFDETSFEVVKGEEFTAPTLNNPNNLTVAYASSNEAVATVDAATGAVTIVGFGSTTITATSEETETHYAGKATYTITVTGVAANIAEFIALCTTKDYPTVVINNPVTVVYQNGSRLYVKDESGYLQVYGYNLPAYNQGDVIPAGIKGSAQMYYDVPELSSPVVSTFGDATGTEVVEPIEVNYTDLTIADVNKYILIKGVKVEGTTMTDAEGNTINYKDQFGVLEEGADLDMVAIVNVSYEAVQIYPVKFTSDLTGITDIELNNNAPVQYFNLQGVEVANPENGLYIRRQGNNVTKVIVK